MNKVIKIIRVSLSVLIVISFLQCDTQKKLNCDSNKFQLLLEDLFKKEKRFLVYESQFVALDSKVFIPPDSSKNFSYLLSPKLKIPDKEFYLHCNNKLEQGFPDSLKLKVIKDFSEMNSLAFTVGIDLSEVNEDTTKLKLYYNFGINQKIDYEGTYTYSFDEKNCKWNILDSAITFY